MASFWYTKTLTKLLRATPAIDLNDGTIKVGLSDTTHVPNQDDAFLDDTGSDDFIDGEPASVTGYVGDFGGSGRKALVSADVTDDLTGTGKSIFDADNLTWTAIADFPAAIAQATVLKEITNDAASVLIINLDFPNVSPNGNDIVLQFAATGIGYITT